jgi:hypothetical protein
VTKRENLKVGSMKQKMGGGRGGGGKERERDVIERRKNKKTGGTDEARHGPSSSQRAN